MIGGYVDPDVIKSSGPRLTDAMQQTARDGIPITIGYGTFPTAGNVIWRAPLVENVIVTRERQGKGGPVTETTEFQYTRSYAIGICEGPITGLLIVKRNGKIVYDARTDEELTAVGYTANDIAASRSGSAAFMQNAVMYTGDESQVADSVMEAHEGVGNVPAYRGLAYIRFENDDLSELRGAIPQFEFVVNGSGNVVVVENEEGLIFHYPLDDYAPGGVAREVVGGYNGVYSSTNVAGGPILSLGGTGSMNITDFGGYMQTASGVTPSMNTHTSWSVSAWIQPRPNSDDDNGGGATQKTIAILDNGGFVDECNWCLCLRTPSSPADLKNLRPYAFYSHSLGTQNSIVSTEEATFFRNHYVVMTWERTGPGTLGTFKFYVNGSLIDTETGQPNPSFANTSMHLIVGGARSGVPSYATDHQFLGCIADLKGYSRALTLAEIQAKFLASDDRYYEIPDIPGTYVDANGNYVYFGADALEREVVTVGDIVADICLRAGLTADQFDVSELTDEIDGYRIATEGGGDAFLNPLLAYAFADCAEWDGKLRFVKRGGDPVFALTADDLVERDGDAFERERVQEAELLRKTTVSYLDPLATYTVTTQQWERRSGTVEAKGEGSLELPVVAGGTQMAQVAEKRGKVAWSETEKQKFSLTHKWTKLTPTDVGTYTDADGNVTRIRLGQREDDSGVQLMEAVTNRGASYTGTAEAQPLPGGGVTPPAVRGPTVMAAFNGPPPRTNEQQQAGIFVAVRGLLEGWVGCDLYISADNGDTETFVGRLVNPARMGWLTADITSSASDTISVELYGSADIDTVTDDQLDANQNVWAIITGANAEFGQSQTSTPNGDGFDLTDTERGLVGEATSHDTDDVFVMVDQYVYYIPVNTEYAGRTLILRAVTVGTQAANNTTTTLVYDPPEIVWDGNGEDDDGEDGPDPDPGGAGTPGTPTSRTVDPGSTTVSLTAGEANATANSAAINTAFASYGTVITPAGTYYIDTANPIEPATNSVLDLATNGTILRAKGSNTTTAPATHRDMIRIDGVHDVVVKGGQLIGYRDYWKANGGVSAFGVSEWAHGIYVTNGAYNVTIYNTTFDKFVGDGISLGRSAHDIHILNIKSTNNRRQGISTGADDVLIENCECAYIGVGDGTAPRAGIDIEIDGPETNTSNNTTVTGCYLHHNAGPGLICYRSCDDITITENRIEYNVRGIYAYDSQNVDCHNNTIKWNGLEGISLLSTCANWDIDGNTLYSNKTRQYGTFADGRTTTTSPTTAQKAKQITVASSVTGTTYGTNTYGPV
ncbi:putative phage tail protein [Lysobacter dokdonensis DS-58]|uniref:Putative phage tail protein n=1 Tax=Lysobacter dokdonensis DS-58 TaxID=1300345 RepID=A0A0A2WNR7_9GAMM|nr:phage tail protein [Lysobacter dokdonensis]KGQ19940.1 putative phage tail protein [Lysobacter dokdonensis DS-58]